MHCRSVLASIPDKIGRGRRHQRQCDPPRAGRTAWQAGSLAMLRRRRSDCQHRASRRLHDVVEGGAMPKAWRTPLSPSVPAGPVVYLCGRVRRPHFEQRLAEAGIAVVPVETYDTATIVRTTDEISAALAATPVDYALVYSANAAEALVETIRHRWTWKIRSKARFLLASPAASRRFWPAMRRAKFWSPRNQAKPRCFTLLKQRLDGAS